MQTATASYGPVRESIPCEAISTTGVVVSFRLRGLAASSGIVEGPCTVIRTPEDMLAVRDGAILVCEAAYPAIIPYMRALHGLVTGRGGAGSIVSGYAREQGIPAVVGINGIMDALHDGDVIRIDGSKGTVEMIAPTPG